MLGYRKIGAVFYSKVSSGVERRAGFIDAMIAHGLPVNADSLCEVEHCDSCELDEKVLRLLKSEDRPDVLVCFNDNLAVNVMNAARDLGLRIPEDLAVTGFGNLPFSDMAAQFNSWRYPIYLLLPVPFALIGALILVWAIGGGLDIFGLMGMIMLIGLSAKNAILYLDFVVERLGTMPIEEALVEAARLRFRPIVMTTLTVLVISFPLVFSGGQGAEFGQRMGIVMFGGIVFSAVLTFFVVPAAFYQFERKRVGQPNP